MLAGDLGCLLNIAGRLQREGRPVHVRHVAEVLAGMTDDLPGDWRGQALGRRDIGLRFVNAGVTLAAEAQSGVKNGNCRGRWMDGVVEPVKQVVGFGLSGQIATMTDASTNIRTAR